MDFYFFKFKIWVFRNESFIDNCKLLDKTYLIHYLVINTFDSKISCIQSGAKCIGLE